MKLALGLFGIALFLFIVSIALEHYLFLPEQQLIVPAYVNITQGSLGFDLNDSALAFGSVVVGGSGTRTVLVHNPHGHTLYGRVSSNGSITSVLSYDSAFVVPPGEDARIPFTVIARNAEQGAYTGFVTIELK